MSKVDYREILRLHALNYSQNRIMASVGSSHHTVKAVLDNAAAKNIMWPLDNDVSNQELEVLLFPDRYKAMSMYEEYSGELLMSPPNFERVRVVSVRC